MKQYVCSKNVFVDGKFVPASLEVEDGKITNILEYGLGEDFNDKRIIPGLIDIHTHGGYGCEINDNDYDKAKVWLANLPSEATTSLLISPYTATIQQMQEGVALVDRLMKEDLDVTVLGSHLEGPFLSKDPKYIGAMREDCIVEPSVALYKEIVGDYDSVKLMTMACEKENAFELMIKSIDNSDIVQGCMYSITPIRTIKVSGVENKLIIHMSYIYLHIRLQHL